MLRSASSYKTQYPRQVNQENLRDSRIAHNRIKLEASQAEYCEHKKVSDKG